MKNKIIMMITFIGLLVLSMGVIRGEERPIYVGDIIELNIDNSVSIEEIELAFEDFEIVDMIEEEDSYLIKVRSFEVGEHSVLLGDSELVISIGTLLTEESSEVIEVPIVMDQGGFILPWTLIKIMALSLSLVSIIIVVVIWIKNRPKKPLSNYDNFLKQLNAEDIQSDDYAYHLTSLFKAYISKGLNTSFKELTTSELVKRLSGFSETKEVLSLTEVWLGKCDTFKYSKDKANSEAKKLLKEELLTITSSIEKNSEVKPS